MLTFARAWVSLVRSLLRELARCVSFFGIGRQVPKHPSYVCLATLHYIAAFPAAVPTCHTLCSFVWLLCGCVLWFLGGIEVRMMEEVCRWWSCAFCFKTLSQYVVFAVASSRTAILLRGAGGCSSAASAASATGMLVFAVGNSRLAIAGHGWLSSRHPLPT